MTYYINDLLESDITHLFAVDHQELYTLQESPTEDDAYDLCDAEDSPYLSDLAISTEVQVNLDDNTLLIEGIAFKPKSLQDFNLQNLEKHGSPLKVFVFDIDSKIRVEALNYDDARERVYSTAQESVMDFDFTFSHEEELDE